MRLKDKVAIITGAGSGIGRATAILFAKEGAKVVVADIDVKGGQETVHQIKNSSGTSFFVEVDISKETDCKRLAEETIKKYGKIDILFNNAGIYLREKITEMDESDWNKIIDINLKSIFLCSKHAIPEMIKQKKGAIINTASVLGLVGEPECGAYCASKGGIIALTKSMATEYASKNIRVNCICPGPIDTPMLQKYLNTSKNPEKEKRELESWVPLKRMGTPEEIAYIALFLASDESSYITGTTIVADGGGTAL